MKINLSQRELVFASFLSGMLFMGLFVLMIDRPTDAIAAQNEHCSRSIAVANALHDFIEEQHGVLLHPDGSRIIRDPGSRENRRTSRY